MYCIPASNVVRNRASASRGQNLKTGRRKFFAPEHAFIDRERALLVSHSQLGWLAGWLDNQPSRTNR
jgi:hypothetical protein